MVISRNARKLFHRTLKIYFVISVFLFLWFGKKFGTFKTIKDEKLTQNALSFHITLALNHLNDTSDNISSLTDKKFFKSIIKGNEHNKTGPKDEAEVDGLLYESDIDKPRGNSGKRLGERVNANPKNMSVIQNWRKQVKEQNNLYKHQITRRVYNMDVFYISAIATDLSRDSEPTNQNMINTVAINGWQRKQNKDSDLFCCFKRLDSVTPTKVYRTHIWDVPDIKVITAAQFMCNVSTDSDLNQTYVGLSGEPICKKVEYVKVERQLKPSSSANASFAICGKVVYGNFSAPRLLEWFEVNKAFGVDHVSLFTYNVTKETETVLKHYQREGLLTLKEFDFPMKMRYPRYLGQKYMMAYMDEQVAVFDCVRRLSRFTYIAIIDVDEFIMSKTGHTNYKSMMKSLLKENPKAAGFTLMTSLFVMDWQKTHPDADFVIGQYTLRTQPMWDRRKSVIISDRAHLQSIWTHGFAAKPTFHRVYLFRNKAVIHHYRKCRSHWIESDTCYNHRQQFSDLSMKVSLSKIRNNLLEKRKLLLNF